MKSFNGTPMIVVGMHRSGTTLITRLLHDMGVFMGFERSSNEESFFFQRRNELILNALCANWSHPDPVKLLNNDFIFNHFRKILIKDCLSSLKSFSYLGPGRSLECRRIANIGFPWGWKDPRNSLLLPLWLDVFPKARVLHVYRNGIDVANSLAIRERNTLNGMSGGNYRSFIHRNNGNYLLVMLKIYRKICSLSQSLYGYSKYEFSEVVDREFGFNLWEKYLKILDHDVNKHNNEVLNICYEDFLRDPVAGMEEIAEFSDIEYTQGQIMKLIAGVEKTRAYSFYKKNSNDLLYNKYKSSYWFERYDYRKKIEILIGSDDSSLEKNGNE